MRNQSKTLLGFHLITKGSPAEEHQAEKQCRTPRSSQRMRMDLRRSTALSAPKPKPAPPQPSPPPWTPAKTKKKKKRPSLKHWYFYRDEGLKRKNLTKWKRGWEFNREVEPSMPKNKHDLLKLLKHPSFLFHCRGANHNFTYPEIILPNYPWLWCLVVYILCNFTLYFV